MRAINIMGVELNYIVCNIYNTRSTLERDFFVRTFVCECAIDEYESLQRRIKPMVGTKCDICNDNGRIPMGKILGIEKYEQTDVITFGVEVEYSEQKAVKRKLSKVS
jgi:hypothetical protein